MNKIGTIITNDKEYIVNADGRVLSTIESTNIDLDILISTVKSVNTQLEENIGDDMVIPNDKHNFILVASIEKEEVNILALVRNENVIYTDGTSVIDKRKKKY